MQNGTAIVIGTHDLIIDYYQRKGREKQLLWDQVSYRRFVERKQWLEGRLGREVLKLKSKDSMGEILAK
jgi:hypothetical protein